MRVDGGNIRGVFPCAVDFKYPISCFVGANGSGKSTLLALAACAFHGVPGFIPLGRNNWHYTFKDFFIFTRNESGLASIEMTNTIRESTADKKRAYRKKPSGKWQDYSRRAPKRVVFFGINRIVPASENSISRHRRDNMQTITIDPTIKTKLLEYLQTIFQKVYTDITFAESFTATKKSFLFSVKRDTTDYSGFNMGAGESSVMYMLYQMLTAGNGAMMVIDEIELGLHQLAQRKFIDVLKEICREKQIQIICSTHSEIILNALPPAARFLVESDGQTTKFLTDITPAFAFGKLAGQNSGELKIFVEDDVAKTIVENILTAQTRRRVNIFDIGSHTTVVNQMAANLRQGDENILVFLDGDQNASVTTHINNALNETTSGRGLLSQEAQRLKDLITNRLCFLPGTIPPEKHIADTISSYTDEQLEILTNTLGCQTPSELKTMLNSARLQPDPHNIFYDLAQQLAMTKDSVLAPCIQCYKTNSPHETANISTRVTAALNSLA